MAVLDVIPAALLDAERVLRSTSDATVFTAHAEPGVGDRIAQAHRRFMQRLTAAGISSTLGALADNVSRAAEAYAEVDGSVQRRSNGRGD